MNLSIHIVLTLLLASTQSYTLSWREWAGGDSLVLTVNMAAHLAIYKCMWYDGGVCVCVYECKCTDIPYMDMCIYMYVHVVHLTDLTIHVAATN